MASIRKRGDSYQVRYRDPAGKEHARNFDLLRDAKAFRASVESDMSRGQYVNPSDKTTLAEYAWRWAEDQNHNPRTRKRIESMFRHHVEGCPIGSRRLATIKPSDMQEWVTDRARVLAASTVRNLVGNVRSVFRAAVADDLIGASPFDKGRRIMLPEADAPEVTPPTAAQVHAIAAAMPDRLAAMPIVQAGCGLRLGELLALRVCDVDFLRFTVRVDGQIAAGTRQRCAPKTKWSVRTVRLLPHVADALAAHLAAYPAKRDGYIFTTEEAGGPYGHAYVEKRFRKACAAAGLPAGMVPHHLRHTFASVSYAAGETPKAIARQLGHRNERLFVSTYGHVLTDADAEDRTRRALEAAWTVDSARTAGPLRAV